jgi:hypothetical protein
MSGKENAVSLEVDSWEGADDEAVDGSNELPDGRAEMLEGLRNQACYSDSDDDYEYSGDEYEDNAESVGSKGAAVESHTDDAERIRDRSSCSEMGGKTGGDKSILNKSLPKLTAASTTSISGREGVESGQRRLAQQSPGWNPAGVKAIQPNSASAQAEIERVRRLLQSQRDKQRAQSKRTHSDTSDSDSHRPAGRDSVASKPKRQLKREKRAAVVADAAVSLTTQANASQTDAKMVEAELREDGGIDVDVEQQCQMAEVQFTISAAVENEAAVAAVSLTTQVNSPQTGEKMVEAEPREVGGIDVDDEQQCQMAEGQVTILAADENEAAAAAAVASTAKVLSARPVDHHL